MPNLLIFVTSGALLIQGPKETLDNTVYSQPALFIAGLAAVEKLRESEPEALEACSVAAGLSLGEYTALVFAGAMTFEDALKLVKVSFNSGCVDHLCASSRPYTSSCMTFDSGGRLPTFPLQWQYTDSS